MHSVPVPINVRCYSNSDNIFWRSEVTLWAGSALQKKPRRFWRRWSGVQLVEQGLGLFQIERVEAFGEPIVDRSQHGITLAAPPLFAQEHR
jgi:hypothetical protein